MQDAVCLIPQVAPPLQLIPQSRDNLEFLQWTKRFWDQNYGGQGYDAVARRRGAPTDTPATIAPLAPTSRATGGPVGRAGGKTPIGGHRAGSQPNETVLNLQTQLREMSTHLEGLEKERDFYFAKVRVSGSVQLKTRKPNTGSRFMQLRDIEILVQQQLEVLEGEGKDDVTLRDIQKILYSTEV